MSIVKNILLVSGIFIISGLFQLGIANEKMVTGKKILYWIDPMEPTVHYDKPGKSHMGMDVIPVYAEDETTNHPSSVIKISPAVVDNLGVRTAPVMQGDFAQNIETVGYINVDEDAISHVHTYTEGWVKKLFVKAVGDPVTKGQLIFQLYSPTLVNAQEEYLIALNTHQSDLIRASQKKLLALGISEKQIEHIKTVKKSDSLINIYAPQNGVVTELNIREGMQVTPEMTILSLADLTQVWLMAEIYESQASLVSVGQEADAQLSSLPGKILKGHVNYVYPQVDPTTRTLKIRLHFDNPDNFLKPGMYANISLLAKPKQNVMSIPQEALIRTEHGDRVIVSLGQGNFEPRVVIAGLESGNRVEIISGLKSGEQVVTSSQFLIDSEANLKGALDRLTALPPLKTAIQTKTADNSSKDVKKTDIIGSGIIKAIQPAAHKLTISHQPISALHWPAMTMDFTVADNVDLSPLKPGSKIQFHLKKNGDEFVITSITMENE